MKSGLRSFIGFTALLALSSTAAHALSFMELEDAKRGDKKGLTAVAKAILAAPATGSTSFLNDPWGAACLLKNSADQGHKPAADLLKEKHKSQGNAAAFLLKGLLDNCQGTSCEPFAVEGSKKAIVSYLGVCYKNGDASNMPNAYVNGSGDFYVCLGPMDKYKVSLADSITAEAFDVDASLMADVYMAADATLQSKLAPAIQKESAGMVAGRYLSDKNFVQARFWYKKADDANGLAEVDKKEKAIAEFEANKRKAEADAIAAQEAEKKKAIADDAAKREGDLKAETERKAADQRVALEKQAADQKLELQRQEAEQQLAHEKAAAQRRISEERGAAVAASEQRQEEGLKSGAIPVVNIDDAIKKYGAQDGKTLLAKPPLTAAKGSWFLNGTLKSVETEVPGQSGKVYMCTSGYGTFAFVSDKDMSHLRINQVLNIVGKHVATQEGYTQSGATLYIPIFDAVEVIGN